MSSGESESNSFFASIGAEVERMFKTRRNSGQKSPSNSDPTLRPADAPNEPVILNVYDMHWSNKFGLGIFHTGVEVYGTEYAFGGHPWSFTGIFEIDPRNATELNEHFKFKEAIELGRTDFSRVDIVQLIESLGDEYQGSTYHLLRKNCNHFSAAFAKLLCGKSLPKWVNRLAEIAASIPFLERSLPKEWLTPVLPDASQTELLEFFQQHAAMQVQLDFDDLLRMSATPRTTDNVANADSTPRGSSGATSRPIRRESAPAATSSRALDTRSPNIDESEEVRADDDVCGATSRSNGHACEPRH